ncbi:unnamed protein product, partial [Durusdinium trenchii]
VIKIQSWRKGITGRRFAKEFKKLSSARRIQSCWKQWRVRRVYQDLRQAVYLAQERWRMHAAKSQMKKLKQEAKEVGALMAKSHKAQEQATSLRKRNDELEAVQLQLQSEKKSLQSRAATIVNADCTYYHCSIIIPMVVCFIFVRLQFKAKELEEALEKLKSQMEEVKVQAEEAATLAASNKVVVETESLKRLETSLEEKTTEISQVKEELMALKTASAKQQEELHEAEGRYQQLLKNTAMQSDGKSSMASTRPRR